MKALNGIRVWPKFSVAAAVMLSVPAIAGEFKLEDLMKSAAIVNDVFESEDRRKQDWKHMIGSLDAQAEIAPDGSEYAERLEDLIDPLQVVEDVRFNYKVYMSPELNAFAAGTGDVRIYSGLMDAMDDDQLLFVIGHEIGHVLEKHSNTGAGRAALLNAGRLIASFKVKDEQKRKMVDIGAVLGDNAFSRQDEKEADLYGLQLLEQLDRPLFASVTAMHRLAEEGRRNSNFVTRMLSTHPDPLDRADIMKAMLPPEAIPDDTPKGSSFSLKKFGQ